MNVVIATAGFIVLIIGLFVFDRDAESRASKALWLPILWLLIAGSRNLGAWEQVLSGSARVVTSDAYLQGNLADQVFLGGLTALGILVLISRYQQVTKLVQMNAPIVLYFLYCMISAVWSDYPGVALRHLARSLGDFVMVMVFWTEPNKRAALRRLLSWPAYILFTLSVLFIRYYPQLGRNYTHEGTPFWTGVTGSKNSLGMICLIYGLGTGWRLLMAYRKLGLPNNKRQRMATGVIFALVLYLLREVDSATSLACFVLASGLMVLTSRPRFARKPAYIHLVVGTVIFVSVFALFFDTSGGLVATLGRNATLTGRTEVWKRAFAVASNPILGAGFESFWLGDRLEWMQQLDANLNQAHNGYIEVYLNLGWVGVLLILAILFSGYLNIVKGLQQDRSINSLKLAYFVVAVIYNCTEAAFRMTSTVWIWALFAVMAVPRESDPEPKKEKPVLEREEAWFST